MKPSKTSSGDNTLKLDFNISRTSENDKIIALAGNPNVGKSTVFNALTGMHQHTGNWPGKTVTNAQGIYKYKDRKFILVDIPGTYSLYAHSKEEEVARDFLCFGNSDAVIVVCDATCMERNLNLVLQTLEITDNVIVCVNLMDEASKKGIFVDLEKLSGILGVPVIGTSAKRKSGLSELSERLLETPLNTNALKVTYTPEIESAIKTLIKEIPECNINKRWIALKYLEGNRDFILKIKENTGISLNKANNLIKNAEINRETLSDILAAHTVLKASEIFKECVQIKNKDYTSLDRKADRILTGRKFGIPVMILLLGVIFWITVSGANIPSAFLSEILFNFQDSLLIFAKHIGIPEIIYSSLIFGVYRVVAWVVSVMLPPMAIFFPLFTLLEDLGYLPRIAFNLDNAFKKCAACGKQALTMCMGFGCNAVGVVGCRIIDSPRERLVAILTNNFVPCNGRFPTLIALISMFFTFSISGIFKSVFGAVILLCVILSGVGMTFLMSKFLSKTILKGEPSSFAIELPPYRTPDFWRIIVRSVFDRTLFVLARAVKAAAPAGLLIWILANVNIANTTLLSHCSSFLEPFASFLGLDGVILLSFILGIPANEIVVPIMIMTYMSAGTITDYENIFILKELLVNNGWTFITAINTLIFSLLHWPCATTIMTIYKETKSLKWTLLSVILPTFAGVVLCFIINLTSILL